MKRYAKTQILTGSLLLMLSGFFPGGLKAQVGYADGSITGTVVEAESSAGLAGVSLYLEGAKLGAVTDKKGGYEIKHVPPGIYRLVATKVGYLPQVVEVRISSTEKVRMNFELAVEVIQMEEIRIEGISPKEKKEHRLLNERQQAVDISDAIGSEEMARTGSGNAAEAMSKMTGASVVDGKYVYVRGLGDRYSSTELNGSELPSPDPYRKAVQMDLFPSSLLDRIVTLKSYSPDKPGNFSGGMVEIWTKRFPENFTFSLSQSTSFNPQSTFKTGSLLYPGGKNDWLGMDDGSRGLPSVVNNSAITIPDIGSAWTNRGKAMELDRITRSFSQKMAPSLEKFPLNQGYTLALGNQVSLFSRPFGMLGSFSYSRKYKAYRNGTAARWELSGSVDKVDELTNEYNLTDALGSDEANWGGLLNLSYKLTDNHEIGLNYIYNQSGESQARYLYGPFPRDLTGNSTYETRVLKYTERSLNSVQFRGEHDLPSLFNSHVDWNSSYNDSRQDEPDLRYFTNNYTVQERGGVVDTSYSIRPSIYPSPNRYFRNLGEHNLNLNLSVGIPFKQWNRLHSQFKFGGSYTNTDRAFRERRFEFLTDNSKYSYKGDPYAFWQSDNIGLVDTTGKLNRFANYVSDASEARGNYDGTQKVAAGFVMTELPLTQKLQFIGGVRLETTDLQVVSHDQSLKRGDISKLDYLPAANFIYVLDDKTNFRLAYGRTLARPTFREMAPYSSFDFVNDLIFTGNQDLERTLIDNYDFRWENFLRNGEVLSASVFYKKFSNPIERVIRTIHGEIQYQNVDNADVYGVELEARQNLDRIHSWLKPFMVGANLSLLHSVVDIGAEELSKILAFDPQASSRRPMQGQSPFVLNLDLSYVEDNSGTTVSLLYNIFGKRLSEVSLGGTPDVYEQSRGILDFTFKNRLWREIGIKFEAKNLLNAPVKKVYTYKGKKFPSATYNYGRFFTLGLTYNLEKD